MGKIKQFADTSAVSLAYAVDDAANESELTATEFNYIPYTTEGFQLSKENQVSTAISRDRRVSGSKNTRGTATGSSTIEFGHTDFSLDMLKLAMMGEWLPVDSESPDSERYLIDDDKVNFFVVEKRVRNNVGGVPMNFFERYFGNLVNEATLEIGSSELVTFSVDTMAAFGDLSRSEASSDVDAGGMADSYKAPSSYEIADSANNIENIVLKDAEGNPLEVVFSDFSLSITNNVREQAGIGAEFASGMALGKVNVQVSGTVYFYDDTVLKSHLQNDYVSVEMTLKTADGEFSVYLPRMKAEAPNANSQGENQDYTQSLTLNGERGLTSIGGEDKECVIAIVEKAA